MEGRRLLVSRRLATWTLLGLTLFAPSVLPGAVGTQTHSLFEQQPLLNELFTGNYSSVVFHSPTAWGVLHYANWCGHCQRFAPVWGELARDISQWSSVFRVGAIACDLPDNTVMCRELNVNSYPDLRMYPPGANLSYQAYPVATSGNVNDLRRRVIDFLSNIPPRTGSLPNLSPARSRNEVMEERGRDRVGLILCDDPEDSYLARTVILDLSGYRDRLLVRRMECSHDDNMASPSIHKFRHDGSLQQLPSGRSRADFVAIIKGDVLGIEARRTTTRRPTSVTTTMAFIASRGVYEQDLVSGVYNSLWVEVSALAQIDDLTALKTYVHHLAKLLPVPQHVRIWLGRLDDWLYQQRDPIPRATWLRQLADLQYGSGSIRQGTSWIGCSGTDPTKRGYPCSLWTIFHTLTVAAWENPQKAITAKAVLLGMRSYIGAFFRCVECRRHFLRHSADLESEVDSGHGPSGVTWLWRTHNTVNNRLHGDPTEDAGHPKVQFPTYGSCSSCHRNEPANNFDREIAWSQPEVLDYLRGFYGENHVIHSSYTTASTTRGARARRIMW